jgi:nucleoside-diphosphate-sugar epimerase
MISDYSKILITGASGFVGRQFLSDQIDVFCSLDVIIARHSSPIYNENLRDSISLIDFDLSCLENLKHNVDLIFHLAGEKLNESLMWEVNVEGTRRLLDWARNHRVKRFIYLSSVGVYGVQKNSGKVDAERIKHPQTIYECSKSAAEDLVRQECTKHGIEYVIVQPSNVIGWADGKRYPLLGLMKMIQRGWFTYFGKSKNYFNYVAVEDVASALAATIAPQAMNRTFIVNTPVSIENFVNWIADELEVTIPFRNFPEEFGRVAALLVDSLNRFAGISLPFGMDRYDELTNTTFYDGSLAIDLFGDVYELGIETAVRQLVQRYKKEGLL